MSMIFFCTNCGAKLSAEVDEAGEVFDCPRCGTEQIVPGEVNPADSAPIQVKAAADTDSIGQKPRRSTRILKVPRKKQLVMSAVGTFPVIHVHAVFMFSWSGPGSTGISY